MVYALNILTQAPIHNPVTPSYTVGKLLGGLIGLFILIAFVLSFIFIIIGGINWITSGGDKAKLETARNRIVDALVGLILIASVWAIINLLFPAIGLSFPGISLPSISRGLEGIR